MELAFRMQSAGTDVFDLSQEPAHIRESYGLTFAEQRTMDSTLMYQAMAQHNVDVISAFSNHGSDLVTVAMGQLKDRRDRILRVSHSTGDSDAPKSGVDHFRNIPRCDPADPPRPTLACR